MLELRAGVKWHGPQFTRRLNTHRGRSLDDAAKYLRDAIKQRITAYQGSYIPPVHSAPGQYPFTITGALAKSIQALTTRALLRAMVFSDLDYARFLELGTVRMAPRPFLRRTLIIEARAIVAMMCRPLR